MTIHSKKLLELLQCPRCKGSLRADEQSAACGECGHRYPVVRGVFDLRPEPGKGFGQDSDAQFLINEFDNGDYAQLLERRYQRHKLPPDVVARYLKNEWRNRGRGEERLGYLRKMAELHGVPFPENGTFLDLGCGTGSTLAALAESAGVAMGIDPSVPDLILARKFLSEVRSDDPPLICGMVESLPFNENSVDLINATDVIEHLPDTDSAMIELGRVLKPGGLLFFNSQNRYSILGQDPHVNLWGIGFLPRDWVESAVQLLKGMSYEGIRPLSLFELRRLLSDRFPGKYRLFGPLPPPEAALVSWKRKMAARLPMLLRWVNRMAWPVLTQYQVLARKNGQSS